MNDAQTWTVIGGFLTVLVALTSMTLRVVRVEISSLDGKIDAVDARLGARIDAVDTRLGARIDAVEHGLGARIDALDRRLGDKIDLLDRDVQTVINRLMEN